MVGLSSSGIGSGLNISQLVSELVSAETQPKIINLNSKEAKVQAEISALGSLKNLLSAFQGSVSALSEYTTFNRKLTNVSDTSVLDATISDKAQAGKHDIKVTQLATEQKLLGPLVASPTTILGSGTLKFQYGTYNSISNGFTPTNSEDIQSISIPSSANTLQGVVDVINQSKTDFQASIISENNQFRLLITSKKTGTDHAFRLMTIDDDGNHYDNAGLSKLSYDPTALVGLGKNATVSANSQDAIISVNNTVVTKSSNTISDAINGVTLNLKKVDLVNSIKIDIQPDKASVQAKINTFVTSYNALMKELNALGGYDPKTKTSGVLQGDSALRSIESQLKRGFSTFNRDPKSPIRSMADIGITTLRDGTLNLNSNKLTEAIEKHFEWFDDLLMGSGKTTDPLVKFYSSTSKTKEGTYPIQFLTVQPSVPPVGASAGYYTFSPFTTLLVDSRNDNFNIEVDGVDSTRISLTRKTYLNPLELANEIQNQINQNSPLLSNGISVQVNYVVDHFVITSNSLGSGSSVRITSIDTQSNRLGLAIGNGVVGKNKVAGSPAVLEGKIGGNAALSTEGVFLKGTGSAEGLTIQSIGGAVGNRGVVAYTSGVMTKVNSLLDSLLDASGMLDSRSKMLTAQVDSISKERENVSKRAIQLEQRYTAQFTALDRLISQIKNTSDFLAKQLATLPGSNSSLLG